MAVRAGGDGTPQSQACVICWNWSALGLPDCDAGPECLLDRVGWGFAELDPLVSSSLESNSLEFVDCMGIRGNRMGRWPGYGGSGVVYGRMAGLWGSAMMYGEMRQACGRMGKPRYRMGRRPVRGRPQNGMGAVGPHGEPAPMADLARSAGFAYFCNNRERRQGMDAAGLDGAATCTLFNLRGFS